MRGEVRNAAAAAEEEEEEDAEEEMSMGSCFTNVRPPNCKEEDEGEEAEVTMTS